MSRREEQTSEDYSSDGSEDEEYDLAGSMKTSFSWDAAAKQLSVSTRQLVETGRKVELKYKARLNTGTGEHHMRGHLRRNFYQNRFSISEVFAAAKLQQLKLRLQDDQQSTGSSSHRDQIKAISSQLRELNINPDKLLPAGFKPLLLKDWVLAPGLTYDSHTTAQGSHVKCALFLRKAPQAIIHSPRTDLLVTGKAVAEVDPRSHEVSAGAGLRLKLLKYNVTNKQDLKITVGLDMATTPLTAEHVSALGTKGRSFFQAPYLKISENNTSVKLQGGKWMFQYIL